MCDGITCFLLPTSPSFSPAKGPGSETICGHCWVNEDDSLHQKVGYCKPFAVTSSNTVRKRKQWTVTNKNGEQAIAENRRVM